MGGAKRANAYARFMESSLIICYKNREKANQVGSITAIGDVKDKNVIILDDMIDTAGTLTMAADMMMGEGARSVRAFATHPVLSGPAYDRIAKSAITELVVSDTIPLKTTEDTSKIKVLSVSELIADVIHKVYNFESISAKFII
jgi:ribose-phosphate pyrophosphokinase